MFCFVVAICDLVHAVEAMYGIPNVPTASAKLFFRHYTADCMPSF